MALPLALVFCLLVNVNELQLYRSYALDEATIADTAASIAQGGALPTGVYWSHIFRAQTNINFHYPPLYFYVAGWVMKLVGITPLALGLLHVLLRLATVAALFLFLRYSGLNRWLALLAGVCWAAFAPAGFYISRGDDLAVLFVMLALLCTTFAGWRAEVLAGVLLGLAFLSYPVALVAGGLLALLSLFHQRRLQWSTLLPLALAAALTGGLWLLWVIPYWAEFRSFFLGFVVPDAAAGNYARSVLDHLRALLLGNGPVIAFQTAMLPLLLADLALSATWVAKDRAALRRTALLHLPLLLALLLIARNRIHPYAVTWLALALLLTLASIYLEARFAIAWDTRPARFLATGLAVVVLLQAGSILGLQTLHAAGNLAYRRACLDDPLAQVRAAIPQGEKVITSESLAFYALRAQNPVYYPAGLSGKTPGGVAFQAEYDGSFRWLVTARPLDEITSYGGKFGWDERTFVWFRERFTLSGSTGDRAACFQKAPLARFSTSALPLYWYTTK